jgi:subtilisin family serine protease
MTPTNAPAGAARGVAVNARVAAAGLLLAAALVSSSTLAQQPQRPIRAAQGELLVQPRAGLSDREFDKILQAHGARRARLLRSINVHVVALPEQANAIAVARALARNPHIKFAELDVLLEPGFLPNDPFLGSAWHLNKVGAPTAWDASQGDGITVAVCDSGVDPHPDLVLVPGYNFYDGNTDTRDATGHGTKVAGAVAMAGQNGVGGAGVSFRTRVMPVRVSDTSGYAFYSTIANCITFAADNGARGANASFLGVCGSGTIQSAASYMRNRGGVVTGSGGNTGVQEGIGPSDYITCVSATDGSDNRTSWSSFGSYIDVAAPGAGIFTTDRGGGYTSPSGTSFSAPVTLGVYALMMAANPSLSSATLDNALFTTARDLGSGGKDPYYGYGRVDAAAAVSKARSLVGADTTAPSVSVQSPTGGQVSGLVAVNVGASDAGGVSRTELYANGVRLAEDALAPYAFSWDTTGLADGPATLQAKAFDAAGNVGTSASVSVTVANDKLPPVVRFSSPAAGSTVTGTVSVNVNATDNTRVVRLSLMIDGQEVAVSNGASLSYSWNTGGGKPGKGKGKGNQSSSGGTSSLTARAEDPTGNVGTASVTVTRQ